MEVSVRLNGNKAEYFKTIAQAAELLEYPSRPTIARFGAKVAEDKRNLMVEMSYKGETTLWYGAGWADEKAEEKSTVETFEGEKKGSRDEEMETDQKERIGRNGETIPKQKLTRGEVENIAASHDDAAAAAAAITALLSKGSVNEDKVKQIMKAEFGDQVVEAFNAISDNFDKRIKEIDKPRTIEIKNLETKTTKNVGTQHYNFHLLIHIMNAGRNAMLVGPAGSFKSSAGLAAAKAADKEVNSMSVNGQTTKTDFMGFIDANGIYRASGFRDAYENGKYFVLDEVDACNPNVLLVLNTAIANKFCYFPNGNINMHKDFRLIATANTHGTTEGTEGHNGRVKMEDPTLDRFTEVLWEYDEVMELEISTNKEWCKKVQSIRKAIKDLHIRKALVSPRATLDGEALLAVGMSEEDVLQCKIWKSMSEADKAKVLGRI